MEQVLEVLRRIRGDIDYDREQNLVDDGILDSFDVVAIVTELINEFDIEVSIDDIVPENFNSASAIAALVERLEDE